MIILGVILLLVSIVTWVYGIPILIMGLYILFNDKEDEIERIKSKRKKK